MNGYVEAGYLAVFVGLGGYGLWLAALAARIGRRERELARSGRGRTSGEGVDGERA